MKKIIFVISLLYWFQISSLSVFASGCTIDSFTATPSTVGFPWAIRTTLQWKTTGCESVIVDKNLYNESTTGGKTIDSVDQFITRDKKITLFATDVKGLTLANLYTVIPKNLDKIQQKTVTLTLDNSHSDYKDKFLPLISNISFDNKTSFKEGEKITIHWDSKNIPSNRPININLLPYKTPGLSDMEYGIDAINITNAGTADIIIPKGFLKGASLPRDTRFKITLSGDVTVPFLGEGGKIRDVNDFPLNFYSESEKDFTIDSSGTTSIAPVETSAPKTPTPAISKPVVQNIKKSTITKKKIIVQKLKKTTSIKKKK